MEVNIRPFVELRSTGYTFYWFEVQFRENDEDTLDRAQNELRSACFKSSMVNEEKILLVHI